MDYLISPDEEHKLIETAHGGMRNAYTPVTRFPVGAAVLTISGKIFAGCNTQSVISGLGVCAERCAIDHAVVFGEYSYRAIAVTSNLKKPMCPCGMCLQYIGEFSQIVGEDIAILMLGSAGDIVRSSVRRLSHDIFGPLNLGLDLSPYREQR